MIVVPLEDRKSVGPYETELEAADDCRVVDLIARIECRPEAVAEVNLARLVDTCRAAGVALGTYDREILAWLAGHNPGTCQVIAGLVARAHGARKSAP